MRKLTAAALAAITLATPAVAGIPSKPGQQQRVYLARTVCYEHPVALLGPRQPRTNVYVDAYVGHRRLVSVPKGSTLYLVGANTVVQTPLAPRFVARVARTVPGCELVEVVFTWRT